MSLIYLFSLQEPVDDPFNDKANNFSNGSVNNGFKTDKFATTFDDQTSGFGAFDDGFGSNFPKKANNDPFAATSNQDPFGDKKTSNANTQDVTFFEPRI